MVDLVIQGDKVRKYRCLRWNGDMFEPGRVYLATDSLFAAALDLFPDRFLLVNEESGEGRRMSDKARETWIRKEREFEREKEAKEFYDIYKEVVEEAEREGGIANIFNNI